MVDADVPEGPESDPLRGLEEAHRPVSRRRGDGRVRGKAEGLRREQGHRPPAVRRGAACGTDRGDRTLVPRAVREMTVSFPAYARPITV